MRKDARGLLKPGWLKRDKTTVRDIDEELSFHFELLTEAYQQNMSAEQAKAAAAQRFGNVEQIRQQCLAISRRTHPFLVVLKVLLVLMFLAGVAVRALSSDFHTGALGQVLIALAVLSGLLLYVRGLNPTNFISKPETVVRLGLIEDVMAMTSHGSRVE